VSKSLLRPLQFVFSAVLLLFVAWQVDLFSASGRAEFWTVLVSASLSILLLSLLVGVAVNLSSALKWWMLIRARGMQVGFWRVFSYYLVGQFYNLFLPTSVGGDVVRSYQLGRFSGRHADALASVFVERYTGVLVLLVVSVLAVLSQLALFSVAFVLASLAAFVLILAFIAWLIFDPRLYRSVKQFLTTRIAKSEPIFSKLDSLLEAVHLYAENRSAIFWAFLNSFLFYFLAVVNVYVTASVFSHDISFIDMLIATPIIMLVMNLPISFGNVGLMEFAYSQVFLLMGYSPAVGVSVALLMRLKSLFDGAMGGVLQPFFMDGNASDRREFIDQDN
jgi:uncharacterized protein (TIRG00374 family)